MPQRQFEAKVFRDGHGRPLLVFRRGRTKYHAVAPRDADIALITLETLAGLQPLTRKGVEYQPRRAASYWLNHDFRHITKAARSVLRRLVARKPASAEAA